MQEIKIEFDTPWTRISWYLFCVILKTNVDTEARNICLQGSSPVKWRSNLISSGCNWYHHWQLYKTFDGIVCSCLVFPSCPQVSLTARPARATKGPQVGVIAPISPVSQPSRANLNTPGRYFINLDWKTIKQFGNGYFITQKNAKILEFISYQYLTSTRCELAGEKSNV